MINYMTLGDVCTDIIDCPHESPEWKTQGIAVVRNFNLVNGQIDMQDGYYVDEETYIKRTRRAIPSEGDIIFSREAPIGNCAIVPAGFKCCLGQRLVLLRVNHEICSSEYLLAVLQSSYVKRQIEQVSKRGSIVSNFAIGDLHELIISVLDNQEDVAHFSTVLAEKISGNTAICSDLEAMAKLLYDYWFVQFDFPNENGKPYKSSGGKMVWNEELKREIPEGWAARDLKDLTKYNSLSISKSSMPDEIDYLDTANLTENHIENIQHILLKEGFPSRAQRIVQPWDVLFSTVRPNQHHYGIIINPTKNMVASTGFAILSMIDERENNAWLYLTLISDGIMQRLESIANSSVSSYPSINPEDITNTTVAYPKNHKIMKQFANKVIILFEKSEMLREENQQLASLRDFLLPMLMNGQVKVGKEASS